MQESEFIDSMPSGRRALLIVVAGGAVFMIALLAVVLWVSTLPRKAAGMSDPLSGASSLDAGQSVHPSPSPPFLPPPLPAGGPASSRD